MRDRKLSFLLAVLMTISFSVGCATSNSYVSAKEQASSQQQSEPGSSVQDARPSISSANQTHEARRFQDLLRRDRLGTDWSKENNPGSSVVRFDYLTDTHAVQVPTKSQVHSGKSKTGWIGSESADLSNR
jgi:hypothetical protein